MVVPNDICIKSVAIVNMPFDTNRTGNLTAGAIRDYSTNSNNGQLGGSDGSGYDPVWVDGKVGGAYDFDGSNDYIEVPYNDSLEFNSEITLSAWVKKEGGDWKDNLNPDSLEVLSSCRVEPSLAGAVPGERYQFERIGYFCVDPDTNRDKLVINRTVTLRDTWAKIAQKHQM